MSIYAKIASLATVTKRCNEINVIANFKASMYDGKILTTNLQCPEFL